MQKQSGLERFQKCMADGAAKVIGPRLEADDGRLQQAAASHLFGGPSVPSQLDLTSDEALFIRFFHGFTDIQATLEVLLDLQIYVRRFPFRDTRVTKDRYLAFIVASHLSEIYILKERLKQYAELIKNSLNGRPEKADIARIMGPVFRALRDTFQHISQTRGNHVHERRYTDQGLERVATFELLARHGDPKYAHFLRSAYRTARSEWARTMRENQEAIDLLINHFFDAAWHCLFADGRIYGSSK